MGHRENIAKKSNIFAIEYNSACKVDFPSNYIYNPLDFNSTVDTLQRSFFHARANEWIIMQGVFPESWCVKVCCIYLFRCLGWIFQQKNYVWKRVFFGWLSEMKFCLLHFDRFQSIIKMLINFTSLQSGQAELSMASCAFMMHKCIILYIKCISYE